ncbi:hypothetical protein ABRY23_09395 [Melioribacteraceae bacterium 4301-Me]|uniref:hypothetical protein n=1 Tax=Pyranulibacter aquaticus TaxID=3163344 RepID=UPI0035984B0E
MMEIVKLILEIFKTVVLTTIAVLLFLIYLRIAPNSQGTSINKIPDLINNTQQRIEQTLDNQKAILKKQDPDAPANRNAIISDLTKLATIAHKYYRGSLNTAGKNSFKGWKIPEGMEISSNGSFSATVSPNSVTLVGTGNKTGYDGTSPVKIVMVIDGSRIVSTDIVN